MVGVSGLSSMKIIFVMIFVVCGALLSADEAEAHVQGVFAFGWGNNFQKTPVFSVDEVAGMTAYFAWKDLEPKKDVYDFSAIDALINKARAHGKKLNIGIYPGSFAPAWLYEFGIPAFSWYRGYREDRRKSSGMRGEWKKSPIPWDARYLTYWKQFISHLADAYRDNESVGYISLTGPTIDTLTNAIILKNKEDWERFVARGYSIDVLYDAWCNVIEHYHKVFRGKKCLVLAIGPERPASSNTVLAARLVDYVIDRKYNDIAFMSVFLNDTWFMRGGGALGIRRILKKAKKNGFSIGYQMAGPSRTASKWKHDYRVIKSLRAALELGINDGASWIEVWHADLFIRSRAGSFVRYKENVEDIIFASKALMGKN